MIVEFEVNGELQSLHPTKSCLAMLMAKKENPELRYGDRELMLLAMGYIKERNWPEAAAIALATKWFNALNFGGLSEADAVKLIAEKDLPDNAKNIRIIEE